MVRLVVDHQQVLLAAQVAQHAVGEGRGALLPALHHLALAAVIAQRQRLPVGDQHPPLAQGRQQVGRHKIEPLETVAPGPRQQRQLRLPRRRHHRPPLPILRLVLAFCFPLRLAVGGVEDGVVDSEGHANR